MGALDFKLFCDLTRLDAARADPYPLGSGPYDGTHSLQVRSEEPLSFVIGVTNTIPDPC